MLQAPSPLIDPIADVLGAGNYPLKTLFAPETVAVIGDADQVGTVGHTVLWNLLSAPFTGTLFLVSSRPDRVFELHPYPNVAEVPDQIDLAVITAPPPAVPAIVEDCIAAGIESAILLSSGFQEGGAGDREWEQRLLERVRSSSLRLLGPNSLGLMNPRHGLNATLAHSLARPGNIGFISQSGALCQAILDWSFHEKFGFSAFVSMGSMVDVGWGDVITYLGDDPYTQSILIHMETVGDARSFLSAAREVALSKPIIVIKGGRSDSAMKAAISHSGGALGSDEVFDAALRRCGVLRVNRISELFNLAEVLAKRDFQLAGPHLAIVTNSGGIGVLATDALVASGGQLAELSEATVAQLDQVLPPTWSHQNPIDILGDADGTRFRQAVEIAVHDPNTDGLLVILTPQAGADPTGTAEQLASLVNELQDTPVGHKPILASWMGGAEVLAGESILNHHQIPTYPYPDSAARLFNLMWQRSYSLRGLYETPLLPANWQDSKPNRQSAKQLIQQARAAHQPVLSQMEVNSLLTAYDIPTLGGVVVTHVDEAIALAERMGYPVVLKLPFKPGVHTPDEGGVQLNLGTAIAVRNAFHALADRGTPPVELILQPMLERDGAYELMLSSKIDPLFGPVIYFGKGGRLLEVYRDRAVALPPLNHTLARRMMEQTQIYQALQGQHGYPAVDLTALEDLLVKFSQLVVDQRWIQEIDINPLWVQPDLDSVHHPAHSWSAHVSSPYGTPSLMVLDARVVLHDPAMTAADLPKLAIRPYPSNYVTAWHLSDGTPVTLRPIRPEDEPLLVDFHKTLSEESVYHYFSQPLSFHHRVAHERLSRICFIDYDRAITLVAETLNVATGQPEILGAARLIKLHGLNQVGQFILVISDAYQGQGLGTELLTRLVAIAQAEGLHLLRGQFRAENKAMQRVCEKVACQFTAQDGVIEASRLLAPA